MLLVLLLPLLLLPLPLPLPLLLLLLLLYSTANTNAAAAATTTTSITTTNLLYSLSQKKPSSGFISVFLSRVLPYMPRSTIHPHCYFTSYWPCVSPLPLLFHSVVLFKSQAFSFIISHTLKPFFPFPLYCAPITNTVTDLSLLSLILFRVTFGITWCISTIKI